MVPAHVDTVCYVGACKDDVTADWTLCSCKDLTNEGSLDSFVIRRQVILSISQQLQSLLAFTAQMGPSTHKNTLV